MFAWDMGPVSSWEVVACSILSRPLAKPTGRERTPWSRCPRAEDAPGLVWSVSSVSSVAEKKHSPKSDISPPFACTTATPALKKSESALTLVSFDGGLVQLKQGIWITWYWGWFSTRMKQWALQMKSREVGEDHNDFESVIIIAIQNPWLQRNRVSPFSLTRRFLYLLLSRHEAFPEHLKALHLLPNCDISVVKIASLSR